RNGLLRYWPFAVLLLACHPVRYFRPLLLLSIEPHSTEPPVQLRRHFRGLDRPAASSSKCQNHLGIAGRAWHLVEDLFRRSHYIGVFPVVLCLSQGQRSPLHAIFR